MARNKYGARKVKTPVGTFDSKKEYARWCDLQLLMRGGAIRDLERQVRYDLTSHGEYITRAIVDFRYYDVERDELVLEDVKGYIDNKSPTTQLWKIKFRMIEAEHGIKVKIT